MQRATVAAAAAAAACGDGDGGDRRDACDVDCCDAFLHHHESTTVEKRENHRHSHHPMNWSTMQASMAAT
jgi:hypothetical protein